MKVSAVSGDLVVKLALGASAIVGVWLLWRHLPSVGDAAKAAGNAAVDAGTGGLYAASTGVGNFLIGAVDAVPGMTDYLKAISEKDAKPFTQPGAPGVYEGDNGFVINGNF